MKISIHTDVWWNLALAAGEVLVAYFAGSLLERLVVMLAKRAENKGVWTFFASFINIFCKIIGVIIALDQLGVSMNLIIGALSALGVGISLALKDNMASVAGGLQLLLTKPFKVGDYIKMGKHEGTVRSIEMTYTTLDTRNNETVIIPNNSLILKTVTNLSSEPDRRVVINYPSGREDISRNERELLIAANASPLVLDHPAPRVTINSYQLQGATLELLAYTKPENYWKCSDQIMDNIHRLQSQGLIDNNAQASEVSGSASNSTPSNSAPADSAPSSDASASNASASANDNSDPASETTGTPTPEEANSTSAAPAETSSAPSTEAANTALLDPTLSSPSSQQESGGSSSSAESHTDPAA